MTSPMRRTAGWCWAALALLAPVTSSPGNGPAAESREIPMIRSGETWRDTAGQPINAHGGGILAHDGRYYWFGEDWGDGWERRGVRVYRSTDLTLWEDRGTALAMSPEPGHPLEVGAVTERPKVIHCAGTGKFVMWFHHELKGRGYAAAHAAVAVADAVEGPYTLVHTGRPVPGAWPMNFQPVGEAATTRPSGAKPADVPSGLDVRTFDAADPEYKRLVDGFATGQESRDMTVFKDDDGIAYLIYSSEMNRTLHVAELTSDCRGYTGRFVRVFPGQQREAPVVFKLGGRYYLVTSGCTGWKPNPSDVAVADSIWGPWTSLGNPWQGPAERTRVSFESQGAFALSIPGTGGEKILFMADRWRPGRIATSPYVWAPVEWDGDKPVLRWRDAWDAREVLGGRDTAAAAAPVTVR